MVITINRTFIALLCAATLSFPAAASEPRVQSAATAPVAVERLLVYGDPIVGAPDPFVLGWFGSFGLNDNGELAACGYLGSFEHLTLSAMFVTGRESSRTLVMRPVQGSGISNTRPAISGSGEVAALIKREPVDVASPYVLARFSADERCDLLTQLESLDDGRTVEGFYSDPAINNEGEVVINVLLTDGQSEYVYYFVFLASGEVRRIGAGMPAPGGGVFSTIPGPDPPPSINDNGDVLFVHGISGGMYDGRFGLFLARSDGIEKIAVDGDELESGFLNGGVHGSLNNHGEVAIVSGESAPPYRLGIFIWSGGSFTKVITSGDRAPDGGVITTVAYGGEDGFYSQYPVVRINDNGTVVFNAKVEAPNGNLRRALFLASPRGMLRMVNQGDRLPTGDRLYRITHYSLNNLGQVAFYAYKDNPLGSITPIGAFLATPAAPLIRSVKLKSSGSELSLRVKGDAMVAGDAIIEIDGVQLEGLGYPEKSHNDDGTTRLVTSVDPRLDELLPVGVPVSVTVFNPLTGKRGEPFTFVRSRSSRSGERHVGLMQRRRLTSD